MAQDNPGSRLSSWSPDPARISRISIRGEQIRTLAIYQASIERSRAAVIGRSLDDLIPEPLLNF